MADRTSDRPNSLVETHKGYNPRILLFHFIMGSLLLVLIGGLAYQQLFKTDIYHEREKQQNQRRILIPGPRGNIYDREGRPLVLNHARFSVTLYLDELRREIRREFLLVGKNYREMVNNDLPNANKKEKQKAFIAKQREQEIPNQTEMMRIARYSVVQRYLDQINEALGRSEKVDATDLNRHFGQELLLPYTLVDDLTPEEYARLIEQLPVRSPLQLYASSKRYYPYGSAAAHTLGFIGSNREIDAPDELASDDLAAFNDKNTFRMKGTIGRAGLEAKFDSTLQGQTGGSVYRVDPAGYRVDPPLQQKMPVQGNSIVTSIDVDLQTVAEKAMAETELVGAAVAIDVQTGEVLTLASKPDYNLNDFSPYLTAKTVDEINEKKAWENLALRGLFPPGSTFKIVTSIAGLRSGLITPDSTAECNGYFKLGKAMFMCHGGHGHGGEINFRDAISKSCNIFFFEYGTNRIGINALAAEARRFHLDKPTGIELPGETRRMIVPDPAWKQRVYKEDWFPGETANVSIGQGALLVTPLQMACFTASVARGQCVTVPSIIHQAGRPPQRTEPIGLTSEQYRALIDGMEGCVASQGGTANKMMSQDFHHPIRVAGKTGTAQKKVTDEETKKQGIINYAWFICFAPIEKPEIAIAVVFEGDTIGEELAGGRYSAPVAARILQKYFDKKLAPAKPTSAKVASAN